MENINNDKMKTNQDTYSTVNNYNNNIIDNSSKNYTFDFDSLFQKLRAQKNTNENIINEYQSNLLMIYYEKLRPLAKITLLKLLTSFWIKENFFMKKEINFMLIIFYIVIYIEIIQI